MSTGGIETINDQLVGIQGGQVIVMMPKRSMSAEDALRHAAWLVVNAEIVSGGDLSGRFAEVLEAVQGT